MVRARPAKPTIYFPKTWLHSRGIRERRFVNQVANLADVGWHENSVISGRGPAEYVPRLREKLAIRRRSVGPAVRGARPSVGMGVDGVKEFLRERRRRMADIIRVAFRQLGGKSDSPPLTPPLVSPWRRGRVETHQRREALHLRVLSVELGPRRRLHHPPGRHHRPEGWLPD